MSQQAKTFTFLLNTIGDLFGYEVAVQAMTSPESASTDENPEKRQYKPVRVGYANAELHGAAKALFIQTVTGLVMCGSPEQLRMEWAPDRFKLDEETETVSANLCVLGCPEFLSAWDDLIKEPEDITSWVAGCGIALRGQASLYLANDPDTKAHEFVSPSRLYATRALFASVMLGIYDHGEPGELELGWREVPTVKRDNLRNVWVGKARNVITKRQRIVIPA